jgi:hypothetical protein
MVEADSSDNILFREDFEGYKKEIFPTGWISDVSERSTPMSVERFIWVR